MHTVAGISEPDDIDLGGLERELAEVLAAARVDEATSSRATERALIGLAGEEATLVGTLLDLAERRAPVVARLRTGRSVRGIVVAVGEDWALLRENSGRVVLVCTAHLGSVRPAPGTTPSTAVGGARPPLVTARFGAVLARLAEERREVRVMIDGETEPLAGELTSVGQDVVVVRSGPPGQPVVPVWIPLVAIGAVALIDAR